MKPKSKGPFTITVPPDEGDNYHVVYHGESYQVSELAELRRKAAAGEKLATCLDDIVWKAPTHKRLERARNILSAYRAAQS